MTIKGILKKNHMLSKKILKLDFHLCILDKDAKDFLNYLTKKGIIDSSYYSTKEDIPNLLLDLIEKSDHSSEKFDERVYVEVIRFGTDAYKFYSNNNHTTGTFEDDDYGVGDNITSLYDDYVDGENERRL